LKSKKTKTEERGARVSKLQTAVTKQGECRVQHLRPGKKGVDRGSRGGPSQTYGLQKGKERGQETKEKGPEAQTKNNPCWGKVKGCSNRLRNLKRSPKLKHG